MKGRRCAGNLHNFRTYALTNSIYCFHDNYHIVMKIWPLTEFTKMDQKRFFSNL